MALLLGCILTTFAAQREYQAALDSLLERTQAEVLSHPGLQIYILRRDESRLKEALPEFLAPCRYTSTCL